MAGATQALKLSDLGKLLGKLGSDLARLDLTKPLNTVAFYLASQAKQSFDKGQSPDGQPWAPLKNPSARRGGPSSKPLRDTGVLMASLAGRGAGNVTKVRSTALDWGTSVAYASYHQQGTGRIPARPFLGIGPKQEDGIVRILVEHIEKMLKERAGG
jgi:phage virion morphogenesis protein